MQFSQKVRTRIGSMVCRIGGDVSGLVFTILATLRSNEKAVAMSVGLYITAAYWFTASTSFANPAVDHRAWIFRQFFAWNPAARRCSICHGSVVWRRISHTRFADGCLPRKVRVLSNTIDQFFRKMDPYFTKFDRQLLALDIPTMRSYGE